MIQALPRGYDTLLDRAFTGGVELSGGQWQRLAAARGFYRNAPLLICDEPSAALDARAEHTLFHNLRQHSTDTTVVLITHRLANIRHADHIYVLHDGHIIQHGRHSDLIAAGGLYADLFSLQASGYQPPDRQEVLSNPDHTDTQPRTDATQTALVRQADHGHTHSAEPAPER